MPADPKLPSHTGSAMPEPRVIILTPVKNAAGHLDRYVDLIEALDYPNQSLSVGLLEGDSDDSTWEKLAAVRPRLVACTSRVTMTQRSFGFTMPPGVPRWSSGYQLYRRANLARARNHLLFAALRDEDWVLWIDVDVIDYPADVLRSLLAQQRDILQPNCVTVSGGETFDRNAWAGDGTITLSDLRGRGLVRLNAVGGTMLLVRADLHRDGLIFPPFRYGLASKTIRTSHPLWGQGEIETEGFAAMAADMGLQCWGMPDLEIIHSPT